MSPTNDPLEPVSVSVSGEVAASWFRGSLAGFCAVCSVPFERKGTRKYCIIHRDRYSRPRPTSAEKREAHRLRMLSRKRAGATRAAMKHWWGQFTPEQRKALVARRMRKEPHA